MTDLHRVESLLSLARKAKKICYGFETVKWSLEQGRVRLVITACDISERTRENTEFYCDAAEVELLPTQLKMADFTAAAGKPTGVIGVMDKGFAELLKKCFEDDK